MSVSQTTRMMSSTGVLKMSSFSQAKVFMSSDHHEGEFLQSLPNILQITAHLQIGELGVQ